MAGPYLGKWDIGEGEMDGPCTTLVHPSKKDAPKATFYDKGQKRWVCFTCAQNRNRHLIQNSVDTKKAGCIPSRDRMLEILMS